jgi:uncharacterized phage protein gp47/JayE
MWFQAMVLQVLQATRLATSTGVDVDTFTADFMPTVGVSNGVASPRLGPQSATGAVTFTRYTAGPTTCFIPAAASVSAAGIVVNAGAQNAATMQTADGTQNFVVIADTTNPNYSATLGGFTLPSSVASITVAVQAALAGAGGNVQAGAISVMTSQVVGIDYINNVATFTNGTNSESDSALKARFAAYILGLSRGDYFGLNASLISSAVTVQYTLTEGYNYDGSYHPGFFFVVADDGSGNPPAPFMATITAAAQAVRPLGIQCAVFQPVIITANVALIITVQTGYVLNVVEAQVAALIATSINSLGLGNPLEWGQIYSWAYSVPGVATVTAVFINGSTGDQATISPTRLTADGKQTIAYATVKAGTVNVS